MRFQPILRRTFLVMVVAATTSLAVSAPAQANPAEDYVQGNINKGLAILNNKPLSTEQRRGQFESFLLGLTDMKRIADFTLGQYRRTASPADLAAFEGAFQSYATAVYQSYFAKYAGQTLKVTGSQARTPDDFIVATQLIDPSDHSGQEPLEVDFRVRTDTGKPVVVDFSVAGIWLALEERDQFTAFLGQNNGNVPMLVSHLAELAKQFRNGWTTTHSHAPNRCKRPALGAGEPAFVFDAVRLIRVNAQATLLVGFVVVIIAFEPFDMAVAFERQHVGGDAVQEPAVMADDHGAAGKFLQRRFQRPQRVDIQIVGGLIEQKKIGARFQHLGQMHAVAFAAG